MSFEKGELQPLEQLLEVLSRPFDDQPDAEEYYTAPVAAALAADSILS